MIPRSRRECLAAATRLLAAASIDAGFSEKAAAEERVAEADGAEESPSHRPVPRNREFVTLRQQVADEVISAREPAA